MAAASLTTHTLDFVPAKKVGNGAVARDSAKASSDARATEERWQKRADQLLAAFSDKSKPETSGAFGAWLF